MTKLIDHIHNTIDLTQDEAEQLQLSHVDDVFADLEHIYQNVERYDMDWAFEHARDTLDEVYDTDIYPRFTNMFAHEDACLCEEGLALLKIASNRMRDFVGHFQRTRHLFDLVELLISFLVIMGIHYLTDIFIHQYAEWISTGLIVVAFAIFKVGIEHGFIHKALIRREKKLYYKTLVRAHASFAQLYAFYIQVQRLHGDTCSLQPEERRRRVLELAQATHRLQRIRNVQ